MDWSNSHWLWRERCWGRLAREASDPLVRAMALALNDEASLAIELASSALASHPLASRYALLYTHNQCQVVDSTAVSRLESEIRRERRSALPDDLYKAAIVNRLTGGVKKAVELCEASLSEEASLPSRSASLSLLGWLHLDANREEAKTLFTKALKHDRENYDALLGDIECGVGGGTEERINRLNRVIVREGGWLVPLVEKGRLQLRSRDWEAAYDSMARALKIRSTNPQVLQFMALKCIIEGRYKEALPWLQRLKASLEEEESRSWWLYVSFTAPLARCCGTEAHATLSSLLQITKLAADRFPHLEDTLVESGCQALAWGETKEAQKRFLAASQLESRSPRALVYLTLTNLELQGATRQVREQAEFLVELREKRVEVETAYLALRSGLVEGIEASTLIDATVSKLQASADLLPFGPDFLSSLDPFRLLSLAQLYPEEFENKRARLLRFVVESVPGLLEGGLSLVESLLCLREFDEAKGVLENILAGPHSSHPLPHLAIAQVYVLKGECEKAKSRLELALSWDLGAREVASYHLTRGLTLSLEGSQSEAIESLRAAITLNSAKESRLQLTKRELGLAYSALVKGLISLGQLEEGEEELGRGEELVGGGREEGVLALSRASLALAKGDPQAALQALSKVTSPKGPHFPQAQAMKADIYLKHMKDEQAFTESYRKLAETDPSTENFLLLGDAYLSIQESELAVESYERAMLCSSDDPKLSCRLARVLVSCHQYAKAIKCYRDSGAEGSLELAELLLKLGQTDKAEAALNEVPVGNKVFVLAKVFEKAGKLEEGLEMLRKAEDGGGGGDAGSLSRIHETMGSFASQLRRFPLAIDCYKKALSLDPNQAHIQIVLANLYMQVGDWSGCEGSCSSVLREDPGNEEALLMLADLAFRKVDFPLAKAHLGSLLSSRPTNWLALARLVQVLRRTAELPEAVPYLQAAEALQPNAPGLAYAKGLYQWYRGAREEAVESLNQARGDPEWGGRAAHDIVEVILNAGGGATDPDSVWNLLQELSPANASEEGRLALLRAFARLASNDPKQVERATLEFTQMANTDSQRVGATLGLGMCYASQKQSARARSVLKRLGKASWSAEEGDHLERAWLLLADLSIGAGSSGGPTRPDDLLARVVKHNRSSARAHELLGLLAEKDHKYFEASRCYEEAWKLGGESDPGLGYRLAYNLVKSKRYADAIAVAQTVLRSHPDYPRIKKDVLDKAITHLRS